MVDNIIKKLKRMRDKLPPNYTISEDLSLKKDSVYAVSDYLEPPACWDGKKWIVIKL